MLWLLWRGWIRLGPVTEEIRGSKWVVSPSSLPRWRHSSCRLRRRSPARPSFFWSPQLDGAGAPIAAARYAALLARCYDVLHAAFPTVNVIGLALSSTGNDNAGSASPGQFIRDVGAAYRSSGRTAPLMDTVAHHPYGADAAERPWRQHIGSKTIALGDWNKLMYNLHLAFAGTAQRLPGNGTTLWYTESGSQSAVAPEKAAAYNGTENVKTVPDWTGGEPDAPAPADTSAAPDLYTQALDSIRLAACQPHVAAYFNFLLADEPRLAGWQSGAYWADLTPKASAAAFRQAFAEASSGSVSCDGLKGGRPSADYLPPAAPATATATALTDPLRVDVSWSAAADDTGVASYRVYRNGAHVGTTTGATTWTNVAVQPGTTYSYTVRALDAAGNLGDASPAATVTTPDTAPPTAPATLAAQAFAGPARVELTWAAATDNVGVARYEIVRDGAVVGTAAGTAWTDTAVGSVATYTYAVVAVDAAGNRSESSPTATVTTLDTQAPTAPGGLAAAPGAGPRVDLSWTASSDDVGVTGYEILRDGVLLATVAGTSYTDWAVAGGGTYAYAVRALDAAGNRSTSAAATASLPDTQAPTAPAGLRATAIDRTWVSLSWTASADNVGVAGYRVYRNGVLVASVPGPSATVGGLVRKTAYSFTVRAVDAAGNVSASSAPLAVKTR